MGIQPVPICKGCAEGEHTSQPFRKEKVAEPPKRNPLESIHMDICGPLPISSLNGERYILCILDDFSRFSEVCKVMLFPNLLNLKISTEKLLKSKIVEVTTDNGGEFCSSQFCEFLKTQGIQKKTITPCAH